MARKRVHLGSKNFFLLTSLSVAALFTVFMANSFLQQQTSTQSEASGDNSGNLTNCNSSKGRSGGIELYNDLKANIDRNTQKRVMCVTLKNQNTNKREDNHLEYGSGQYTNIWKFNNQTKSFTLRANKFCHVWVEFYNKPNFQNFMWQTSRTAVAAWDRPVQKTFNLPQEYRNKASSIKVFTKCDNSRYFASPTPTPYR